MPQLATYGAKVPVSVITGFLGSGKSTLLNYILSQRGDKNIAVVENEFGEVNIDRTLVGDKLAEREDLVSMENGCVCCSLRKDIVKAFSELQKRSQTKARPMDHILLETTGLADPSPVAFTFFANPWIAARFKLDSITCVVDAKHLMQHLEDGQHAQGAINEAIQQLAFSDLILLNKIDLVSDADKADVLLAIKRINNTARIIECQLNSESGRPELSSILGINSFSVQRALTVDPQFLDTDSDTDCTQPSTYRQHSDTPQQVSTEAQSHPQPDQAAQPAAEVGEDTAGTVADGKRPNEPCACLSDSATERKPKRRRKKLHDLSDVSSVGITTHGQLDEYRFNMFMRDLLGEKAKDIFRCKGVLCVHGYGNQKFVFQGVHETICYGPAETPWQEGEARLNQIVFIGRGLDRKMLIEGFRTCLWRPLPEGWEEALDEKTNKPYYWNKHTGQKSWLRPSNTMSNAADVTSHQATTQQPLGVAPSRKRTVHSPANSGGNNSGGNEQGGTAVAVA